MIYNLKNEMLESYNGTEHEIFPKYTSQLINWANQNAQGTRPKVVGQMSEIFPEFLNSVAEHPTIEDWKNFYTMTHPESVREATDKIGGVKFSLPGVIHVRDSFICSSVSAFSYFLYRQI